MTQEHASPEREERADNDNRAWRKTTPAARAAPQKETKPGLRQRWNGVQASKTAIFWLLAAAVVLTMVIGFVWGGWVTGGSARETANTTAEDAVVMRLAPICVAQFNQDPQREAKLVEMQEMTSFARRTYVSEQGWATMPGEDAPDRDVATACAALLMEE